MRINIERTDGAFGTLTLLGGAPPGEWPAASGVWGLERAGLDGWYDSVDPRLSAPVEIPGADGSFWPERIFSRSRIVTIRGFYSIVGSQASEVTLGAARDVVAAFRAAPVRVTVSDEVGDRFVTGYVSSQVTVTKVSERAFKFTVIVTCPDPVKYGTVSTFDVAAGSSTVKFFNSGRADVSPIVQSLGRISSLSVKHDGFEFSWTGNTTMLTIDLLDGIPRGPDGAETGTVVFGEAIRFAPGESIATVISDQKTMWSVRAGWL